MNRNHHRALERQSIQKNPRKENEGESASLTSDPMIIQLITPQQKPTRIHESNENDGC